MTHPISRRRATGPSLTRAAALGAACALLAAAGTALAQPAGVTVTDLGNFVGSTQAILGPSVTLTPAAPVAWFKIRVPRIAPPHRYLDISTSGAGFGDSEIALFAADGTLIAIDDDDGANNFSALSFGITNPSAAGRQAPIAEPVQSAGEPNDGRDGTLSGLASIEQGGTAGDYYIAVVRFDAMFGNNFSVTPPIGNITLPTLLTVRMGTPGFQLAPAVNGNDQVAAVGDNTISLTAFASANTTGVSVDLSSIGGPSNESLEESEPEVWDDTLLLDPPLSQIAVFPITFRATNAIGDVTIDVANLTVRPPGSTCGRANESPIATTPGTTVYTYTTTLGTVDGPWTNACFTSTPTGNDVWFRFQPTQSGTLTLSTCNADTGATGTQPDTLLGFRGSCGDGGFSTCGDDVGGCGLGTRLTNIPVTAGQQYNIAVRAWGADIVNGKLAVTFTPLACNPADIADAAGNPGSDGAANNGDFQLFFQQFFTATCPACGPTTTTPCNPADIAQSDASAGPDGCVNNGDFQLFFTSFFVGC